MRVSFAPVASPYQVKNAIAVKIVQLTQVSKPKSNKKKKRTRNSQLSFSSVVPCVMDDRPGAAGKRRYAEPKRKHRRHNDPNLR